MPVWAHSAASFAAIPMAASYDLRLVTLSVLLGILASYAALDLAGRVTAAHGAVRLWWLLGGATAVGIGTWSLHYVGMLAFRLPVPIQYDWPTTLLALLASILASATALFVVSRRKMGWLQSSAGSLVMGGGIVAMHYIGMASMRLPADCYHSPELVAFSVLLAVTLSLMSLRLTFVLRDEPTGQGLRRNASAVAMGAAMACMHYTAMAGARFTPSAVTGDLSYAISVPILGAVGIAAVVGMVLALAVLTSVADRLEKQRSLLDELFEQCPQAVALLGADGRIVRVNREFPRIFGYTQQEALGRRLAEIIAPEESLAAFHSDQELLAQGFRVDTERACQRKDGRRLFVAMVGVPAFLPHGKIAVYAIYSDITERKRSEERLREYEKVVEGVQDMIVVVDRDYRYVLANRAFLSYRGVEREAVIGRLVPEVLNPGVFENVVQAKLDECFRGNVVKYELRYRYPERGERDLLISYFPIEGPRGVDGAACELRDITDQKAAEAALRKLSGRLLRLEDEERRRLARELHDATAQLLAALAMNLAVVSESAESLPPRARGALAEGVSLADQCLGEIRTVSYLLHPRELEELGLESALTRYLDGFTRRSGIRVDVDVSEDLGRFPQAVETALFRIVQECLTNIHRHSGCRTARLRLLRFPSNAPSNVVLEVTDDGHGIRRDAPPGVGIASMRERVQQLEGHLDIETGPGGTTVRATIPLEGAQLV
jgi:PAS domain S-box-containing protein